MKITDVGSFYITQKDFFYTKNGTLFSIQDKKEKIIVHLVNSCWGSKYEEKRRIRIRYKLICRVL